MKRKVEWAWRVLRNSGEIRRDLIISLRRDFCVIGKQDGLGSSEFVPNEGREGRIQE